MSVLTRGQSESHCLRTIAGTDLKSTTQNITIFAIISTKATLCGAFFVQIQKKRSTTQTTSLSS
ncbi:hypothetical protein ACTXT7_001632 [Hymenolepis weldensis]